ncbi:MAG: lamin tail domain-containing protein [Actinomycetota bacterium]|nr:lamin tail domain-containing protein [Actinomycetota bacterium]
MRVRQARRPVLVAVVPLLVGLAAAVTVAAAGARGEREVIDNARQEDPAPPGAAEAPGKRQPSRLWDAARRGISSLEELDGIACTVRGRTGTVALEYDGENRAVLTCVVSAQGGGGVGGGGGSGLKVNEVMTGTAEAGTNEFVEIVNPSSSRFDAGGYRVDYRAAEGTRDIVLATIPAGTTIAARGHYLLAGSGYAGGATADQAFSTGLAAGGGGVALRSPAGDIVDSVGYGSASNAFVEGSPAPAVPADATPGKSTARLPDGHDTNNNAADFDVTTPTPRAPNQ